jgi:Ceramidase
LESSWTAPIDLYCERTDLSFWSEPLNAVTNAAFLIAAFAAFLRWRRAGGTDSPALVLILVLTIIGIGSFLFHTFADRWSVLADVIPITVFIYVYFFFAMRRFFDFGIVVSLTITVAFLAVSVLVGTVLPPGFLNGSGGYLPALLAILIIGAIMMRHRPDIGRPVLAAGAIFIVSVTARSIDMAVCDAIPIGTHSLWHVLNALTLYVLLRVIIRARPATA